MSFQYIRDYYNVPAEKYREVVVGSRKGVILTAIGQYIGVHFYDNPTIDPLPCHATSQVQYLETFNDKPPGKKLTRSQQRYREYLSADSSLSFGEWIKWKKYSTN